LNAAVWNRKATKSKGTMGMGIPSAPKNDVLLAPRNLYFSSALTNREKHNIMPNKH
jgi:hypothetical protein